MSEIHKQKTVGYSADEMYALVNDIESYPSFLPWCTSVKIFDQEPQQMMAQVNMELGKINQSFTTRNTMQPGRKIEMQLVKGPFNHLVGKWVFEPLNEKSSEIILDIEFEFKNRLLKLALNGAFNHVMETLVDSFIKRAEVIYG